MPTLFDLPLTALTTGMPTTLEPFRGRVLLIVNTASQCGLTPQYAALEKLYGTYRESGFEVLGFPANDFGGQEPGTNQEIQKFCETSFNVTFPMFEKTVATGPEKAPLYEILISEQAVAVVGKPSFRDDLRGYGLTVPDAPEVSWNFEKFLIDRRGRVVGRFAPDVLPTDPVLIAAIEHELPPL